MNIIFITGTDTDIGKTLATGLMGRYLRQSSKTVITQKIIQTGCASSPVRHSQDVMCHRKLMGIEWGKLDASNVTCPYHFAFPGSPHLAAQMEDRTIDPRKITEATETLAEAYDIVLVEGVGGIYVPLTNSLALIDYLAERNYPLVVVTSSRLGSINHTLMTLDIAWQRGLEVLGVIYNRHPPEKPEIANDSKLVFKGFLKKFGYPDTVVDLPEIDVEKPPNIDFLPILNPILGIYKAVLY